MTNNTHIPEKVQPRQQPRLLLAPQEQYIYGYGFRHVDFTLSRIGGKGYVFTYNIRGTLRGFSDDLLPAMMAKGRIVDLCV